jgi:integrase
MSNLIYPKRFYNEYQKNRFLNEANESEKVLFTRLFSRAFIDEKRLDKDLYDFSLPEIKSFLNRLNPTKFSTARMYCYFVQKYIDWAIKEDLRKTNINPLVGMIDDDFINGFIDESKETLFDEDTINEIIEDCKNDQDAVIIKLIFEGVGGEGLEELLNLREKDVDEENNALLLTNKDGSTRTLKVSDECIKLVKYALAQKEYYKRNGEVSENSRSKTIALVDNDYVLKTGITKNEGEGKADKFLVYRRLSVLGELFEKPYLTFTNIRDSGMLKMAKDLLERDGKLEKEQYIEISERFNIGKIRLNGELQYNYFTYKKTFLNEETIKKIYG